MKNQMSARLAQTILGQVAERTLKQLSRKNKLVRHRVPEGPWAISLRLVSVKEMRRLNLEYRGKDEATDVLSFPSPDPFYSMGRIGDLAVCRVWLKKQAKQYKISMREECEILLTHGLLHLLGFDHERDPDAARQMAKLEQKILNQKGLITRASMGMTKSWKPTKSARRLKK